MKTFDQGQSVEVRTTIHDDDWRAALYKAGAGDYHAVMMEDGWYSQVVEDDDIRAVRKLPEEWEEIDGITIIDPDGWDRTNLEESWNTPIDREQWERFSGASTVTLREQKKRSDYVLVNNENILTSLVEREAELLAELAKVREKIQEFKSDAE